MTRIVNRPEADSDLAAIALFVAQQNVERAKALVARPRMRCRILATHPFAGRPRPELGESLRSLVERPYVILYRADRDLVEIVAFLHGAQDLPSALAARLNREPG